MRRYANYQFNYKDIQCKYFITQLTFYKNQKLDVVRISVKKNETTLKYFELKLAPKTKLNNELKFYIEKYITDWYKRYTENQLCLL